MQKKPSDIVEPGNSLQGEIGDINISTLSLEDIEPVKPSAAQASAPPARPPQPPQAPQPPQQRPARSPAAATKDTFDMNPDAGRGRGVDREANPEMDMNPDLNMNMNPDLDAPRPPRAASRASAPQAAPPQEQMQQKAPPRPERAQPPQSASAQAQQAAPPPPASPSSSSASSSSTPPPPSRPAQELVEEAAPAATPSSGRGLVVSRPGAGSGGRIGERLVGMGFITGDQLNVALQEKKLSGKMLGEVLVDLGFITDEILSTFLAESSGFEVFNPRTTVLDGNALKLIDKNTALKHRILPVSIDAETALIAMADPYDVVALDVLRRFLPKGVNIRPLVSTSNVLMDAIDASYGYASKVSAILKEIENADQSKLDVAGLSEEEAFTHPIVRLVDALVSEAVKVRASDLHFEPEENFVRLRYRVDGELFTAQILHRQHWNAISQRLKIMANLNIADKMTPQDGRISMDIGGREIDFRVSSLPTVFGENIVMRVLDKNAGIQPLATLGFSEHNLGLIRRAQEKPEGIIIVTGPTGSGKTTSLYSMLNEINTVDINIQTLEDPVEYSLPMIRQTPVREGILEFADGIKALLRQDPDVIFIGEIRDKVSAEMALQAAMTGHQVYTTLHTNDSFGAIPRLLDLGMVPGMIAGNIIAVFAQRLARTLCPNCKQEHSATPEECVFLGADPAQPPQIYAAKPGGCDLCGGSGYKGRVAVAEILAFDDDLDEVIARGGTKADIKHAALEKGFKSMKDDGILKVLEGKTSLEALAKVVDIRK